MHKTRIVVVALALIFAACGGTSEGADTTLAPGETTSAPAPTTAPLPAAGTPVQMAVIHAAIDEVAAAPPSHIEGVMEMAGIDSDLGPMDLRFEAARSREGSWMFEFADTFSF